MKFTPMPIDGCFMIEPELRQDSRGTFARFFCDGFFAKHGLNVHWPQCNLSVTQQIGTVRGMHFQHSDAAEIKLIRCVRGAAFDVLVDMRASSPTFGHWASVELSEDSFRMVYAAAGCAHGFQTLRSNTELMYLHSTDYSPQSEGGVHHADPKIGIDWPQDIMFCSKKDSSLNNLADARKFI